MKISKRIVLTSALLITAALTMASAKTNAHSKKQSEKQDKSSLETKHLNLFCDYILQSTQLPEKNHDTCFARAKKAFRDCQIKLQPTLKKASDEEEIKIAKSKIGVCLAKSYFQNLEKNNRKKR